MFRLLEWKDWVPSRRVIIAGFVIAAILCSAFLAAYHHYGTPGIKNFIIGFHRLVYMITHHGQSPPAKTSDPEYNNTWTVPPPKEKTKPAP